MTRPSSGPTVVFLLAATAVLTGCHESPKFAIELPKKYSTTPSDPSATTGAEGQTTNGETSPTAGTTGDPGTTPMTTPPAALDPGAGMATTPPSVDATKPPPVATDTTAAPVMLKFAFDKGSEIKFKTALESTSPMMSGSGGGAKPITTSSMTTAKVVDVKTGSARVEMTVSNMKMSGGSDMPEAQKMMQKMAKDSEGAKISQLFDSTGKPTELKYLKGTSTQATLAGLNVDTGFFGLTYATKAVRPGDTWTHSVDYKNVLGGSLGPMGSAAKWTNSNVTTVFTLKSVNSGAGTAIIGISAQGNPVITMKMPTRSTTPQSKGGQMPSELKMSIKVNGAGTATVDLRTGIPKEIVYEMETQFTNPMGSGTMSQKTKGTVTRS